MRISAKRANLGKIMISRKKPISRVKKIIKNKTNKRKTKKMKKKHKKVKHKTTRKIRSMSRIGRRRTYHGGAGEKIPKPTDENFIGQGSYGTVYTPSEGKPGIVAKLHEIKQGEGCKLKGEYDNHRLALELLTQCKKDFKDIKLEIPKLQDFHYLTRSTGSPDEYETTKMKEKEPGDGGEDIIGCIYKMSRIWPAKDTRIKNLIKEGITFHNKKTPTFLHLSTYRTENKMPVRFDQHLEISFFKNSLFSRPPGTSQIIKEIGFIELDQRGDNVSVYETVFGWGYSMMLFYFYCAYNGLVLRDSEFALGGISITGAELIYLFCYDFNQCREPKYDSDGDPTLDVARQYLHLSGMKIGSLASMDGMNEEEQDVWKFMPIPTTSPKFFVNLVNKIFQDAKQAEKAEKAEKPSKFHIYIKNVVDQILLWLMQPGHRDHWKWSLFPLEDDYQILLSEKISELFKMYNIQKHYYYSIQSKVYNDLDHNHKLKKAKKWTKDTDNQEGMFRIDKTNMNEYIAARKMTCQFGLDELETNSIEFELEPGKNYFCNTYSRMNTQFERGLITPEFTFLVNINLDIEMQETIIKKMVIDGFIRPKYIHANDLDPFFFRLLNLERKTKDSSSGFDKMIEMLDKKYISMKQNAYDEASRKDQLEPEMKIKALGNGDGDGDVDDY